MTQQPTKRAQAPDDATWKGATWKGALIVVVLLVISLQPVLAQRHIKGQIALTPYVGILDNFPTSTAIRAGDQGYVGGLSLSHYTTKETWWTLYGQYDVKYYQGLSTTLNTDRFLVGMQYAFGTLHDHRRRFYLAPMGGVVTGYERVNQNQFDLPAGRILSQSSGVAGLTAGLEGEFFIAERMALVLAVDEKLLFYSNVSRFRTSGTLGLRFSFFKN